jgi:hypothetical protein
MERGNAPATASSHPKPKVKDVEGAQSASERLEADLYQQQRLTKGMGGGTWEEEPYSLFLSFHAHMTQGMRQSWGWGPYNLAKRPK